MNSIKDILAEEKDAIQKTFLNESGIRIPKGTHAAKIAFHEDLDGVFSAILTYRQLIRQGLDPKNIRLYGVQYSDPPPKMEKALKGKKGQMVALVDFARVPDEKLRKGIDFWSDHHIPGEGAEGKGGGRIGATEFKSDTQHLEYSHAQNLATSETVNAVTGIDSAEYSNIMDVLRLPKEFKKKGRMERLAILSNALLTNSGIIKQPAMIESFIKETEPSLISFYNNILRYNRLSEIQSAAIKELSKKEPDWDFVNQVRKEMPTRDAAKEIETPKSVAPRDRLRELGEDVLDDYKEFQQLKAKGEKRTPEEEKRFRELSQKPLEKIRQSRQEQIEKHTDTGAGPRGGKISGFEPKGSIMHAGGARAQRYLWTQLHKEGIRYPFVVKKVGPMIQVAVNPDLPDEVKKQIDLTQMAKEILSELRDEVAQNKGWAFKIIERDSGGHAGITNIANMHLLGLLPDKADREELKKLKEYERRVKNLKVLGSRKLSPEDKEKLKKAKAVLRSKKSSDEEKKEAQRKIKILDPKLERLMPSKDERMKELIAAEDMEKDRKNEIQDEIIRRFQSRLDMMSQKFPKLTSDDPEFEMRQKTQQEESVKERILNVIE